MKGRYLERLPALTHPNITIPVHTIYGNLVLPNEYEAADLISSLADPNRSIMTPWRLPILLKSLYEYTCNKCKHN